MTDCETYRALGREMAVAGEITPLDALVSLPTHMDNVMGRFERIIQIRDPIEFPQAWILADTQANSGRTLTRSRDLASIFDGTTGMLTATAVDNGLNCLPPVDSAHPIHPIDLANDTHLAIVATSISKGKPGLVTFAPPCVVWCKTTDFAAKNPAQMKRLIGERARQRELMSMSNVALLVAIVISYGGHVLIENPTHSKFWQQDFVKEMCTIIRVKHPARTFF